MMEQLAGIARRTFETSCPDVPVLLFSAEPRNFGQFGDGMAVAARVTIGGEEVEHQTVVRFTDKDAPERMADVCGHRLANWARVTARKAAA